MCNISKVVAKNTNHKKLSKPSRKLFGTVQRRFGTKKKLILIFAHSCCKYVRALACLNSPKVNLSFRVIVLVFRTSKYQKRVFRPAKRFRITGFEHLLQINSSFRHPPELTNEAMSCHAHGETHLRLPTIHIISVHGWETKCDLAILGAETKCELAILGG